MVKLLTQKSNSSISALIIRLFLFFEIFVVNGLLFFWIIYKCDRILIESLFDMVGFLGSGLIVLYTVRLWSHGTEEHKKSLKTMQAKLNFFTAVLGLFIVAVLQYTEWLYYPLPFSWTFNLWWLFNGFAISCAYAFEKRTESIQTTLMDGKYILIFLLSLIFIFILGYFLVIYSKYLTPLFFYMVVTHTAIAFDSVKKQELEDECRENVSLFISTKPIYHAMVWCASLMVLISFFFNSYEHNDPRALEANWELISSFIFSWGTLAGMGISALVIYLAIHRKESILIWGLVLVSLSTITGLANIYILGPFLFGYGFFLIGYLQLSQKANNYAFYGWSNQFIWTIALVLSNFYGVLFQFGPIINGCLIGVLLLNTILVLFFISKYRKNSSNTSMEEPKDE